MKKILITIIAVITLFGVAYAGVTYLSLNKTRSTVALKRDTTATYNLKYADYVNYTLYVENQDTCNYYLQVQGKMLGVSKWVIVKYDTLSCSGNAYKTKNTVLRTPSSDLLYGFNEFRILLHSPAIEADDSLGVMKYYLQISYK